jgi:hypothetical protein
VIQLTGQVVPVRLDAEAEGYPVAQRYQVMGFPMILFLNGAGTVEGQMYGFRPPASFTQEVRTILQAHKDFPILQDRYRANQKDVEAVGKLAGIYAIRGNVDRSKAYLAWGTRLDPQNKKGYLTHACVLLGGIYEEARQFGSALPLFIRAAQTGKDPYDVTFAHLHVALCHIMGRQPDAAMTDLKAALAVPNAPQELQAQARHVIDILRQHGGEIDIPQNSSGR